MNTKAFHVEVDVQLDRAPWRKLGYGDQPSKAEVFDLYGKFLETILAPGIKTTMSIHYLGGPGHYKITTTAIVSVPGWRRLGFGDRASKKEVQNMFADFTGRVSSNYAVNVSLSS